MYGYIQAQYVEQIWPNLLLSEEPFMFRHIYFMLDMENLLDTQDGLYLKL